MASVMRISDIMSLPRNVAADCDMTFTDPPWEGALKMFETWMTKQGLPRPGNTIEGIADRLFALAPRRPCFVEYSIKGHETFLRAAKSHGHKLTRVVRGVQTTGKPYVVMQFNSDMPVLDVTKGWAILDAAMRWHKPKRVFEPFAGHGQHARRIVKLGADVVASEVNPERARKAFAALGLPVPA